MAEWSLERLAIERTGGDRISTATGSERLPLTVHCGRPAPYRSRYWSVHCPDNWS